MSVYLTALTFGAFGILMLELVRGVYDRKNSEKQQMRSVVVASCCDNHSYQQREL